MTERNLSEAELEELYAIFRSINDSTDALIFSVDRHYRYTCFNSRHAAVMKNLYGAEIETGRSLYDYMTVPEDREISRRNLDRALTGEQVVEEAYSGDSLLSRSYFRVSHSPIKSVTGEIIGVAVLAQDMTSKKLAEQQLALINFALNNTQEAAFLNDTEGHFIYVNDAACHSLGYSRDEMLAMSVADIVDGYPIDDWDQHISNLKATGAITFETRHKTRDGCIFPVEMNVKHFIYNGVPYNLALGRDITQRKRMEESLSAREHEFRTLAESLPDNIVRYDLEGRAIYLNPVLERNLGTTGARKIGKRVREFHTDGSYEAYAQALDRVLDCGEDVEFDFIIPGSGDNPRIHHIRMIAERNEHGQVTGVLAIGSDITERRNSEQALLDRQKRLTEMAIELSMTEERERRRIAGELHDQIGQNLLLAKIKLNSYISAHPSLQDREELEQVITLQDQIIGDVRSMTQQLAPPILSSAGLEAALEWLCNRMLEDYGLFVEFHDDRNQKPLTEDMRTIVFHVCRELLINVAKHAQTGSARLVVNKEGERLMIIVEDQGIGLDLSKTSSGVVDDEGFGLFNIRERIRYMGGEVLIESAPGQGTHVTVRVPLDTNCSASSCGCEDIPSDREFA